LFKRSVLAPTHVISDLCGANAETGWVPVEQTYPSGHHAPYSILAANASKKPRIHGSSQVETEPSRNLRAEG
jgi:hypothetical protein